MTLLRALLKNRLIDEGFQVCSRMQVIISWVQAVLRLKINGILKAVAGYLLV